MNIKITTLSENTAAHGFIAEWGLSLLIEVDGQKILMDTGWGFSAVYNAQLLGIDLSTIDTIVLSHGHRDHTGGLRDILGRMGKPVTVIAHPDIWTNKYSSSRTGDEYIGIPYSKELLQSLGARFTLSKKPVRLTEHVWTKGEVPMVSGYEIIEDNLLVKKGGELCPDPLMDDLALSIQTDYGLIIIAGCAHHGIINTVRCAQKVTGQEPVYAVIGGTHLYRASEERIWQTVADLREIGIKKLGVSHCTGFQASAIFAQEFGEAFFLNNAGHSFTLP